MTARASLFTEREGHVYRCVPNTNISSRFVSILLTFSHGFQFFFFEMMVINARSWHFKSCWVVLLANSQCSPTILCMSFHITRPCRYVRCHARFAFSLSTSPVDVVKKWCSFIKINMFHQYFAHPIDVVSFQPIWCHPHTLISHGVRISIPNF